MIDSFMLDMFMKMDEIETDAEDEEPIIDDWEDDSEIDLGADY